MSCKERIKMKQIKMKLGAWFLPVVAALTIGVPVGASYIIPNGSITAAKLAAGAVGTTQLATGAVTQAKRASLGQQVSSSSGTFTGTSGSYADVTNLSVTFTSTGRPVLLMLQPDNNGSLYSNVHAGSGNDTDFTWVRDSTKLSDPTKFVQGTNGLYIGGGAFLFIDTGASAASHTWKFQYRRNSGASSVTVNNMVMVAFEL
jgi:hypothetical protein